MLSAIEQKRLHLSRSTKAEKKADFGQFFTPESTATFMANLFPAGEGNCHLLDAGAGIGSLSAAFLARWQHGLLGFKQVSVDAFEIDKTLGPALSHTLEDYAAKGKIITSTHTTDYIYHAVEALSGTLFSSPRQPHYTHAILNPPYKKIGSQSAYRLALRSVGIETVNLYTGFVALALAQLAPGGHLVAIIPRSFCNGPYYRPFRQFILARAAIRHIHLFDSRSQTFRDDQVLQENIILHLERAAPQASVCISTSTDDRFHDLKSYHYPFGEIVFPHDRECFIHIPSSPEQGTLTPSPLFTHTLAELGLQVSTGPVVDFRLKEHLLETPEAGSVPLIYPTHLGSAGIRWPIPGGKKPNALQRNPHTEKWLYPAGFYCAVRRFSSKEEKRRIVATAVDPTLFGTASALGFENHLNVFHENKHGLPEALANGLSAFLNSTRVDENFRRFNGHTQVNATDLRQMRYPSREILMTLGQWAKSQPVLTQADIDRKLDTLDA